MVTILSDQTSNKNIDQGFDLVRKVSLGFVKLNIQSISVGIKMSDKSELLALASARKETNTIQIKSVDEILNSGKKLASVIAKGELYYVKFQVTLYIRHASDVVT